MNSQRGFTLLEVMVAASIFAVGFLGIVQVEVVAVQNGQSAQRANQASALAAELASRLQTLKYTDALLADTSTNNDSSYYSAGTNIEQEGADADHCAESVTAFPAGWVNCAESNDILLGVTPKTDLVFSTGGTEYYMVWDVENAQLRRPNGVPDLPPNPSGGPPIATDGKIIVARVLYRDPVFGTMHSTSAVAIMNNPAIFGN